VIDPVTAFGVAVTAFNTVQKLVKAGKEIESVASIFLSQVCMDRKPISQ